MENKILLDSNDPKEGYIRVSSILSNLNDFSMIDPKVLDCKKGIGSTIHNAIHAHSKGIFPLVHGREVGYMQSFLKWIELTGFEFVKCEIRLYDEQLKITGCVDAIVKDTDSGENTLIDFKTCASANRDYWQHQGAFYHHLSRLNGIQIGDEFRFVQLNRDGKLPRVHTFTMSELLWRQCLKLYYAYITDKDVDYNKV